MYGSRDYVEGGGLMSYGPNFPEQFRRAGDYVDKILRGTKPGHIPVEQPSKFDLVINLTTAKVLGLTIPESFLLRADEVIEWHVVRQELAGAAKRGPASLGRNLARIVPLQCSCTFARRPMGWQ